jgi:hypothetical protein
MERMIAAGELIGAPLGEAFKRISDL